MLKVRFEVFAEIMSRLPSEASTVHTSSFSGHERNRHRDLAKDVSTQGYARVRQFLR